MGTMKPHSLAWSMAEPLQKRPPHVKFCQSMSNAMSVYTEICWKNLASHLSRSLKVTRNGSITYLWIPISDPFLLVIHGTISNRFLVKEQFQSKMCT